jgi:uncharacterized protein (TIGR02996 family)
MTAERVFLDDIRDRPDDDAVRLIYADWLEERAGPADAARAELIRVQVELALGPRDEAHLRRLEARGRELLTRHAPAWMGPLGRPGLDWWFRRGFPEALAHSGLFRSAEQELPPGCWHYFRFFPDRTTLSVTSTGTPPDLVNWFRKDWPHVTHGRYTLWPEGDTLGIRIDTNDRRGDYVGVFVGEPPGLSLTFQGQKEPTPEPYRWVDLPGYHSRDDHTSLPPPG